MSKSLQNPGKNLFFRVLWKIKYMGLCGYLGGSNDSEALQYELMDNWLQVITTKPRLPE